MEDFKTDNTSEEEVLIRVSNFEKIHANPRSSGTVDLGASNKCISPQSNYSRLSPETPQSIPLVPNDRNVPNFLENERSYEQQNYKSRSDNPVLVSRSTQTLPDSRSTNSFSRDLRSPTSVRGSAKKPEKSHQNHAQELMLTRSQLSNVHRKYQQLKMRFNRLHTDYYKLMSITGELTSSLSHSIHRQPVSIEATLKNCMRIYPDLFEKNIRESKISLASESDNNEIIRNRCSLMMVPLLPHHLNYKKIKFHLINANVRTKLLLLQALRWKITLSQADDRDEVVNEYISNDLLGLHGQIAGDSGRPVLPYLLLPLDVVQPHPLQQSTARLLNAFASLKCGRDYLALGPTVLNVVVQCLDTQAESIDAFTCDMILAMLQKLSLRKHQRLYMIASGLVEWLIHHLKAECHSMGTYRLEYAAALLMNLSLHKEAQIRAAAMATMLMSTLIALLATDHLAALPYINGALNSFLANSSINEEARLMGLGHILEYHRKHRTGELRKHLEYILQRHQRQPNQTIDELLNDDDDREEFDVLEDELDEMDPVKVSSGELFGETLLSSCYSVLYHKLSGDVDALNSGPTIVQQISENALCESTNVQDTEADKLMNKKNLSSRESIMNAVDSSTAVSGDSMRGENGLGPSLDHLLEATQEIELTPEDEEEAFAAKPKITRTPPGSGVPPFTAESPVGDD